MAADRGAPIIGATSKSLVFSLLAGMAAGTFTAAIFGVLGTFIVDEFQISRAALGLVVALNTVFGGIVSPFMGKLVDRVGAVRSMRLLFAGSAAAFWVLAVAPVYGVLLLGALVGGAAQAMANPATNKVIALYVPIGVRATVTGLKQSGVQFALFAGGLILPTLSEWIGWRWAVGLVGAVCLAGLLFVRTGNGYSEQEAPGGRARSAWQGRVPWLAAYGLFLGFSGSALFFLPLFTEEELGRSVRTGGAALAVVGISAVVGRVLWAQFADRGARYRRSLGLIAGLGVVGMLLFTVADNSIWWLWFGAVIVGASSSSWNSVGMLAVIDDTSVRGAGAASGVVLFGFLVGLGVGPPIYGWTYDTTASYMTMWNLAAIASLLAVALTVVWKLVEARRHVSV